jgi:hypothetical protein
MQKIYPRTNPTPFSTLENSNAKPAPQIDDALREFARQDTAHLRRVAESAAQGNLSSEPESSTQVITDLNSLVQRVAGVSLDQLDDAIVDLRQLRDFLDSEGKRIQREISGYLQLNQIAIGSTKSIVDNIVQWKEAAHITTRTQEGRGTATERGDLVGSAPPSPPSSTASNNVFIPPK